MTPPRQAGGELDLDASGIELLAARIARLVAEQLEHASTEPSRAERRLLTATEVSQWWGVRRAWVYAHAAELGAVRIGDGERPRLRFDPERVEECLRSPGPLPATSQTAPPRKRRSTRIRGDSRRLAFRADPELSSLSREI
jgi:hypothetical protein